MFKNNMLAMSFPGERRPFLFHFVSLLAVVSLILAAWFAQKLFEDRLRSEKGELLTVVLEQTLESLLEWNKERQKVVSSWAQTYIIREATHSLLALPETKESLQTSVAQEVLREVLSPLQVGGGLHGYFVISRNKVNLASSRDVNLADVSVIPTSMLERALAGETLVTLPQPSKISLPSANGELMPAQPTMFSLAPISAENGDVVAILAFRLDALGDFSSILHLGDIGKSGETYAFNKAGQFLSECRFTERLRKSGLLDSDKQCVFNLELREPGGNVMAGYQPGKARVLQPLTLMAESAIHGNNGLNLDGYNDYRGVPVIGAWRWNEALDIGVATEIDIEEAYATLLLSRYLMLVGASLSIFIIIVLNVVYALARRRVAKSEASLVNAQLIAHLGSWQWDIAHNRLEWSDETYRIFKRNPEQFKVSHETFLSAVHPDDRESVRSEIDEALNKNKPYEVEHRVVCPDGTERIVLQQATVVRNAVGKPSYMQGSVLDITDRKKAEQELRVFKTTSDMIEDSVFMFDPDTLKFFYVNQAAIQQVGYTEEEFYNMTPVDIKPNFNTESFRSLIDPLMEGPERTLLFQTEHQRITGSLIPVDIALQYLAPEDESPRFVAIVRNFSERQRIENQLKAEKEKAELATRYKSEFLANMSHEIRTPMNGVLGMIELLETTELNEKQNNYLKTAESSANSLLTIINDILDFSKIEAGRMQLEDTVFNLHKTVEDSIAAMSKQAESKGLDLNCFISADIQPLVIGDPVRLRQIITNLVSNAIKFTEVGEVNIRLSKGSDDDQQVSVCFEVADTGVGVEEEKLNSLFDAFTQADGSTTRKYGGSGLGLTICRKLVSMMGGNMSVSSQPGSGSIFSFTSVFPKVKHRQDPKIHRLPTDLRVLVVDDNDTNRSNLCNYLSNWNVKNVGVADCDAVLPALRDANLNSKPYGVILMDFNLPETDVMKQVEMIKAENKLRDTRVILLSYSGNLASEDASTIERYLTKPVRQTDLYDALLQATGLLQKQPAKKEEHRETNTQFKGAKVLLVDDVATNQAVGAEMLNGLGIEPVLARHGRAALNEIKKTTFDLVLMDCQMPLMDGYEATGIVRAQELVEDSRHLPIIALTAHAMKGDREACLSAGMDDYMSKPISLENLRNILGKWLPDDLQHEVISESSDAITTVENVSGSVLDNNTLKNLRKLAGDRFSGLIDSFERDVQKNLASLHDAMKQDDVEAIVLAAHAMKGAGMNMAALSFSDCCKALEIQAREGAIVDAQSQVRSVEDEYQDAIKELRGLC